MLNGTKLDEQETQLDQEIFRLEDELIRTMIDNRNRETTIRILTERQNIENQFQQSSAQFAFTKAP